MEGKGTFRYDGSNLEGKIIGDLAGSSISVVFRDSNDRKLDQVILESPLARRLAGLDMICNDLKLSQRGLRKFLDLTGDAPGPMFPKDTTIFEALWSSSVVLYCKAFVNAEGRVVVLKFNQVFKGDMLQKLDEHNRLMRLRNEHMAHCGALGLQQHLVYLLKKPEKEWESGTIQTWGVNAMMPHPRWVKSTLELVTAVLERVQVMRKKAEDGLKTELGLGVQDELRFIVEVNVNKP